jgi:hypothetical protein
MSDWTRRVSVVPMMDGATESKAGDCSDTYNVPKILVAILSPAPILWGYSEILPPVRA